MRKRKWHNGTGDVISCWKYSVRAMTLHCHQTAIIRHQADNTSRMIALHPLPTGTQVVSHNVFSGQPEFHTKFTLSFRASLPPQKANKRRTHGVVHFFFITCDSTTDEHLCCMEFCCCCKSVCWLRIMKALRAAWRHTPNIIEYCCIALRYTQNNKKITRFWK